LSTENPVTLSEWETYIKGLTGDNLRSKALAANSVAFVRRLESEGTPSRTISGILQAFARRFLETDQALPGRLPGSYLDYGTLLSSLEALEAPSVDEET